MGASVLIVYEAEQLPGSLSGLSLVERASFANA
ncbi:hypothetical protein FHS18_006067 [Paenibacillus phyllosphaerae]|uniref:Uncharacterized protein n=1 Tax=Paenibacillus phyllosphaerae TaxID=274593 RepID=A0A7W5FQY6_9BACL|nr:hypothetical protein [Paenibacillus phyllosphaerae]